MGAADSKQTIPLQLSAWSESEQVILRETFTKIADPTPQNKQPLASVSSFKTAFSLIPGDLCVLIYSNFVNSPSFLDAPLTFAQFVDGLSRVLKHNNSRLSFYLSLFGSQEPFGSDTVAKIIQYDTQLWFKLANIEKDEDSQDETGAIQQMAQQICEDIKNRHGQMSFSMFEKWANDNLPNLGDGVAYAIQKCAGLDKMIPFVFPTSLFQSHILISRLETYIIYWCHTPKTSRGNMLHLFGIHG